MKKLLLTLALCLTVSLIVYADDKDDALQFFNSYVTAANSYSPEVPKMYSKDAKIIRQVVKPDNTTKDVFTDTDTYIKQMKIGQMGAKLRHYSNSYTNISATKIGDGVYKVTSLRQPSGDDYKLKTYMILKKQPNGNWLIIEEMMQTKEQLFLRYAKD